MKFSEYYEAYVAKLALSLHTLDSDALNRVADVFFDVWSKRGSIFLAGNGGSAGNSIHLANDFIYGAANPERGGGAKIVSLAANSSVLTCLANDVNYESIFSLQLDVFGEKGDVLIVLSGSGNSPNVIKAIKSARERGMISVGILGFDGGKAIDLVDIALHLNVADMQFSEDAQLIIMHALMQYALVDRDDQKWR